MAVTKETEQNTLHLFQMYHSNQFAQGGPCYCQQSLRDAVLGLI